MKPVTLALPLLALTALVSLAQEAGHWAPDYRGAAWGPVEPDRALRARMDASQHRIETALKDYLVVLEPSPGNDHRRLGLPLTSLANDQLHIAYDGASKGLVAQWQSSAVGSGAGKIRYQASVGESGAVGFAISTRF